MSTTQGIKLDKETVDRLKVLAKQRGRSPHWIMRTAVEDYLGKEEAYEREKQEDLANYEDYLLTGKAVSHKEAKVWFNNLAKNKRTPWPK